MTFAFQEIFFTGSNVCSTKYQYLSYSMAILRIFAPQGQDILWDEFSMEVRLSFSNLTPISAGMGMGSQKVKFKF